MDRHGNEDGTRVFTLMITLTNEGDALNEIHSKNKSRVTGMLVSMKGSHGYSNENLNKQVHVTNQH